MLVGKATKQVLDKMDLENKTLARITPKEREEQRLWDPVALREVVINAIVHNDYTSEVPPKFEFFDDRIEIYFFRKFATGHDENEFFEGFSLPRNKELVRVFRDLDMVEHLGSGVPCILRSYSKECFRFTENFLRMTFLAQKTIDEVKTTQKLPQTYPNTTMKIIEAIKDNPFITRKELSGKLGISIDGVKYHIKILNKEGILKREGSNRAGKWIIIE